MVSKSQTVSHFWLNTCGCLPFFVACLMAWNSPGFCWGSNKQYSASSTLGFLSDNVLHKSTHSLTHCVHSFCMMLMVTCTLPRWKRHRYCDSSTVLMPPSTGQFNHMSRRSIAMAMWHRLSCIWGWLTSRSHDKNSVSCYNTIYLCFCQPCRWVWGQYVFGLSVCVYVLAWAEAVLTCSLLIY